MQLVREQLLLLLLAIPIVANSLLTDGRPQANFVMAGNREDKLASGQTPRAFAGQLYNTQKLLEFDRGETPAYKAIELLDYLDDLEDRRVREQVAQAGSNNVDSTGGTEDQTYGVLPTRPSTWSKRRRRIGVSEELRLGEAAALDRAPCSSSGTSPGYLDFTPSDRQLEHPCGRRTEDKEERAKENHSGTEGQVQPEAEKEQTEVAEEPQKFEGVTSWTEKRATPFSILGTARRRALRSHSGKRVPGFHSWGGKRSSPFAALGKSSNKGEVPAFKRLPAFSSWGGKRDPAAFSILTGKDGEALRIVDNKRFPVFSSWRGKRDPAAFSILTGKDGEALGIVDSKSEPVYSILSPERNTAVSMWTTNSDPAFNILASHDYPAFTVTENNYQSTPVFGVLGSKRDSAFSYEGGKREPAFYSWGGKRDSAFSPWGGKKSLAFSNREEKVRSLFSGLRPKGDEVPNWLLDPEVTKRGNRFSGWGAKRDLKKSEDFEERRRGNDTVHSNAKQDSQDLDVQDVKYGNAQSSPAEAYEQFPDDLDGRVQLGTLNNNGGKAKSEQDVATYGSEEGEQTNHENAVGGRELPSLVAKRSEPRVSGKNRVGKAFSPWGGKRSGSMQRPDSPEILFDLLSKRGNYRHMSLGSKKWDPSSVGTVFSSWGGKRSVKPTAQNILKVPPQGAGRQFRRGADFYSWGGKR